MRSRGLRTSASKEKVTIIDKQEVHTGIHAEQGGLRREAVLEREIHTGVAVESPMLSKKGTRK